MFTTENTEGFTAEQIDLLNAAVRKLMADSDTLTEKSACDVVNNNWSVDENTLESLTRI